MPLPKPDPIRSDLPQGTLDLLILKVLALEPLHGYAIAQRLQQVSRDVVQVQQGTLYPALHRLEDAGYVLAEWGASENNRRAKYYRLTTLGKKQLQLETVGVGPHPDRPSSRRLAWKACGVQRRPERITVVDLCQHTVVPDRRRTPLRRADGDVADLTIRGQIAQQHEVAQGGPNRLLMQLRLENPAVELR